VKEAERIANMSRERLDRHIFSIFFKKTLANRKCVNMAFNYYYEMWDQHGVIN